VIFVVHYTSFVFYYYIRARVYNMQSREIRAAHASITYSRLKFTMFSFSATKKLIYSLSFANYEKKRAAKRSSNCNEKNVLNFKYPSKI